MTYKELKEKLNALSEDELNQCVKIWGEDINLSACSVDECDEDQYYNPCWDSCELESSLSEEDLSDPDTRLEIKKGTFYLYVE